MILVVDQDPEVLEKAQKVLNRDRQVFLASTAESAFEIVQQLSGFSVVLVDLDLPGAYLLIQHLHDEHPKLLIIAITGAMRTSVLDATKEMGVVEVLNKPITPDWKPVVERIRATRVN